MQCKIGNGDNFIKQKNQPSWCAEISKEINRHKSGVQTNLESLHSNGLLEQIDCADIDIKRPRGGSKPRICYKINIDMDLSWFIELLL